MAYFQPVQPAERVCGSCEEAKRRRVPPARQPERSPWLHSNSPRQGGDL